MRSGTTWRSAVLASLALLMSGQLCMLTTCVPRLGRSRVAAHACCRALPAPASRAPAPHAPGSMPCDMMLHAAAAPVLPQATPYALPAALAIAATAALAPPARAAAPVAEVATGPPLKRLSPAPAGLRAPPQA